MKKLFALLLMVGCITSAQAKWSPSGLFQTVSSWFALSPSKKHELTSNYDRSHDNWKMWFEVDSAKYQREQETLKAFCESEDLAIDSNLELILRIEGSSYQETSYMRHAAMSELGPRQAGLQSAQDRLEWLQLFDEACNSSNTFFKEYNATQEALHGWND